MNWDKSLSDLQYYLAELYPLQENSIPLADRAGINPSSISVSNKGIETWYNILEEAHKQQRLGFLVDEALRDYPDDSHLKSFKDNWTGEVAPLSIDRTKSLILEMIDYDQIERAWNLIEPVVQKGSKTEEDILVLIAEANRYFEEHLEVSGSQKEKLMNKRKLTLHSIKELIQDL